MGGIEFLSRNKVCIIFWGTMVGPYSTVSQSILLDLLLWLEDKAAQRHKSNGMFSTIVPVLCLTDEGRSKEHSVSQIGTHYTCILMEQPCILWITNFTRLKGLLFSILKPFGAGIIFFLILAHLVYKMWIIQEQNKLELWNKLHFEEKKKTDGIHHV